MPRVLKRLTRLGVLSVMLLVGLTSQAGAAPISVCGPPPQNDPFWQLVEQNAEQPVETVCTFTRPLDLWFGTLTVQGVVSPSQDFLEASDHFTNVLGGALQTDAAIDPRVNLGITPFLNLTGAIEWVIGVPENLPAQLNLLAAFTAADVALDGLFGPGTLSLIAGGTTTTNYRLSAVPIFCPDDSTPPACDGSSESFFLAGVDYRGQVNMFEQNAIWTRDETAPSPVPEPATLTLLGTSLAVIGVRRWRRPR